MHPAMHLALRIARRLGVFFISLLGASLLIFVFTNALPGDVAQVLLGTDATPEAVARLRSQLGLDRSLPCTPPRTRRQVTNRRTS